MSCDWGIDPSSSSSGLSIVVDGEIKVCEYFVPHFKKHKKDWYGMSRGLSEWTAHMLLRAKEYPPDRLVQEVVSMTMGMHTVRMLAYYEAPGFMVAYKHDAKLYVVQASSARRRTLGKSCAKEDAFQQAKERWPGWITGGFERGGDDQSDSLIMAFAADSFEHEP